MCSSFFNTLSTYVIIHCCYVIRFRNMQLQPYSIKFIDIRLHNWIFQYVWRSVDCRLKIISLKLKEISEQRQE